MEEKKEFRKCIILVLLETDPEAKSGVQEVSQLDVNVSGDRRRKQDGAGKDFRLKCRSPRVWANQTGVLKQGLMLEFCIGRNDQC